MCVSVCGEDVGANEGSIHMATQHGYEEDTALAKSPVEMVLGS